MSMQLLVRRLLSAIIVICTISCVMDAQYSESPRSNGQIQVKVRLVNVFTSVTDAAGAPVVDLNKDDFTILEDGHPEKIALFEQQSGVPLSIILALDISGSLRKDQSLELESAKRFTASVLRKDDALALYTFSNYVNEVVPFSNRWRDISDGMHNIHAGGGTSLFDAIYLASERLTRRNGRKVLVVITDGGDTTSKVNYQDAVRQAVEAEAIVYSIIVVPVNADAGRNTGGEHALIQISTDTGGKYYYADSTANLDAAFQQISRELRTQYLLGYYPSRKTTDSTFRSISVKVANVAAQNTGPRPHDPREAADGSAPTAIRHPGPYKLRYRSGYYTQPSE